MGKVVPIGDYKKAIDEVKQKTPLLKLIFKKYSIFSDKQKKIFNILIGGYYFKLREERLIQMKCKEKNRQYHKTDFNKLKKDIALILKNQPNMPNGFLITKENKELCEHVINEAIGLQKATNKLWENMIKSSKKKSALKLKKNPKDLEIYTTLTKKLIRLLNPIFRNKIKDKWLPITRIKEKTFQLVTDILNAIFPALNFSPEQLKARYHR